MIAKSQRWQKTAMAAVAVAVLGLWGSHASALSLGRMTVLSALGEPLRAEIDIPDINAEEAASLKTTVALPEAYQAAGIEYNPALRGLQMALQRKPDGRAFILVNSDRAMNDPFVDLILEASWSSGRIVRDYTMLFDPPNLRQAQTVTVTAPQVSSVPASVTPAQTPAASTPSASTRPAAPARTVPPPPPTAETPARTPVASSKRVTIKSGDTASRIAAANKPAGVSLDQMLVALLRRNPDAFVDGNINRIKAGAVMNVPSAEQAQATPAHEASQIVVAQSRDFNDFRRKLAGSAPAAQVSAAARQASGSVQARVEDKKPAALTPDKLTLSKGAVQGKAGEDNIARERSAREAASRAEELSKTVSELSKLGAASGAAAPTPAASAPHAASATVTTAVTAPVAAPPASAVAPQIAATSAAPTASAPKADFSASVKRPAVPPIQAPELSLLDEILENPLVSAAAGGLVALLAGFGFYRIRQRKHSAQVDSAFLESRLQPDSFFGASGGQRIDTNEAGATGSSMMYSPSQLDAADDVDPVAEADVYLAYGRDLQAEEILKEALRIHPGRVAIHQKLLEIYAKRRDIKAFENIANEACKLTGGHGQDWERVRELGMEVDPSNALYQPGDPPVSGATPAVTAAGAGSVASSMVPQTLQPRQPSTATPVDLDLDLDFSPDDEPSSAISEAVSSTTPGVSMPAIEPATPSLDMDFGLAAEALQAGDASHPGPDSESPDLPLPELPTQTDASPPAQTPSNSGMLEFDLGSLSLDLGTPSEQSVAAPSDDPFETKLALAEEFSAIGDTDGARALIEEIIAEASGEIKARAQSALSQL